MNNCKQCNTATKNKHFCTNKCNGLYSRGKSKYNLDIPSKKQYIEVKIKNLVGEQRRIYLHRLVYESINGQIKAGFVVHHKDENKRNNSPENLDAIKRSEHTRYHTNKRYYGELSEEYINENSYDFESEFGF